MRVGFGLVFLFVAAVLAVVAYFWKNKSAVADQKSGVEAIVSWVSNEKRDSENNALVCGVGAAIFGGIGLIILLIGGRSSATRHQPRAERRPLLPEESGSGSGPSLEERLTKLEELLSKGLISRAEYDSRGRDILDAL